MSGGAWGGIFVAPGDIHHVDVVVAGGADFSVGGGTTDPVFFPCLSTDDAGEADVAGVVSVKQPVLAVFGGGPWNGNALETRVALLMRDVADIVKESERAVLLAHATVKIQHPCGINAGCIAKGDDGALREDKGAVGCNADGLPELSL